MDDEDSIDLETLQAQIDMSMSFAQDMVSSWIKPSRKLPSRGKDIEAELKEYMRRPPRCAHLTNRLFSECTDVAFEIRLGVGAAVPENSTSSRDIARLKGQLVGKGNKRPREDEPDSKEKDRSDDEGESRGGAIKKKARVDPFGNINKKKKNTSIPEKMALASPRPPTIPEADKEEEEEANLVTEGLISGLSTPSATPQRKKHKKKRANIDPAVDVNSGITLTLATLAVNSPSIPPNDSKASPPTTPPNVAKVVDVSLTKMPPTPQQLLRQAQSAALLQYPLLNLDTPGNVDSENENDANSDAGGESPKKKKRRRRKKKKGSADASTVEATK
ncbi:hypothetical protein H0H87_007949 [Tephrocybe sp. NHM501043]|nr:hypothetical protein H0H87_007949 [Tephrocybe sp. NHM501043]